MIHKDIEDERLARTRDIEQLRKEFVTGLSTRTVASTAGGSSQHKKQVRFLHNTFEIKGSINYKNEKTMEATQAGKDHIVEWLNKFKEKSEVTSPQDGSIVFSFL